MHKKAIKTTKPNKEHRGRCSLPHEEPDTDDYVDKYATKQMLHYSLRSSGCRPKAQSCCILPAGSEQFGKRNSKGHPMGWKVVCLPFNGAAEQKHGRKKPLMRDSRL